MFRICQGVFARQRDFWPTAFDSRLLPPLISKWFQSVPLHSFPKRSRHEFLDLVDRPEHEFRRLRATELLSAALLLSGSHSLQHLPDGAALPALFPAGTALSPVFLLPARAPLPAGASQAMHRRVPAHSAVSARTRILPLSAGALGRVQ